jgi:tetratricopeptide (TPR) repeat protein
MQKVIKYFFVILLAAVFCPCVSQAQTASDNPFLPMAGRPYKEYAARLTVLIDSVESRNDMEASFRLLQLWEKTAQQTGDRQLELAARIYRRIEMRYLEKPFSHEDETAHFLQIAETARREGFPHIRFNALYGVFINYRFYLKNYELAFEYANELDRLMRPLPPEEFPEKMRYFLEIASLFSAFDDYEKAMEYFDIVIASPRIADEQFSLRGAYNNMGVIYREDFNNLALSDSMFIAILNLPSPLEEKSDHVRVWDVIAKGNLGKNAFLRKEYDTAVPLLRFAMDTVTKLGDFNFAAGSAITLADIYLNQGKIAEGKAYIDSAQSLMARETNSYRWPSLYQLMSKYYALTGNILMSFACTDSSLVVQKRYDEEFNAIQRQRAEQKLHRMQQLEKDEKNAAAIRWTMTVSVSAILICGLIFFLLFQRKRRKLTERFLAQANQRWAGIEAPEENVQFLHQ